jgi:hypothetical protein
VQGKGFAGINRGLHVVNLKNLSVFAYKWKYAAITGFSEFIFILWFKITLDDR